MEIGRISKESEPLSLQGQRRGCRVGEPDGEANVRMVPALNIGGLIMYSPALFLSFNFLIWGQDNLLL